LQRKCRLACARVAFEEIKAATNEPSLEHII
jgi:hypothetical protein